MLQITYSSNKLKKQLTDIRELVRAYGQLAKKINQRHEDLASINNLSMMKLFPQANFHELKGDRKGSFAVDVSGNYRMIFIPNHDPVPTKDDGGLDLEAITAITILEIEDYH